jgi:hypothetical protein
MFIHLHNHSCENLTPYRTKIVLYKITDKTQTFYTILKYFKASNNVHNCYISVRKRSFYLVWWECDSLKETSGGRQAANFGNL